jgi:biopolymer transport protein ExbD
MKKYRIPVIACCLVAVMGFSYFYLTTHKNETALTASQLRDALDPAPIIIAIAANGDVSLRGEKIQLKTLQVRLEKLAKLGRSRLIRISADRGAPLKRVLEVMEVFKAATRIYDGDDLRSPVALLSTPRNFT